MLQTWPACLLLIARVSVKKGCLAFWLFAPINQSAYRFDALFEKAMKETNDSFRYKLYQQADQVMINNAPVVPLWYDMVIHLVQPNVKGFQPNALNLLELRRVKIE